MEVHWGCGVPDLYVKRLKNQCFNSSAAGEKIVYRQRISETSGRWPVLTVIDWINEAHRFLTGLFFDYMRDEVGCVRDQNVVEHGGIHSQVGESPITDRSRWVTIVGKSQNVTVA